MTFQIPSEYKDFVTSSDDLLKEFTSKSDEDRLTFRLYFDQITDLQHGLDIYNNITAFINNLISSYIWHYEAVVIKLSVPTSLISQKQHESNSKGEEICVIGSCRVGNNIEDEWFLTYVLFELSKQYSDVCIVIADNDGEFLLIEAADELPDWLSPENSTNRVWIKNGLLHIIHLDEGGIDKYGHLKLPFALSHIRSIPTHYTDLTLYSTYYPKVQAMIMKRTCDVYPSKTLAIQHTSLCILPRRIAHLLTAYPQLITPAMHTFINIISNSSSYNKKMINRYLRDMSYFQPSLADVVAVDVRHTKGLHAQLTFNQSFRPPTAFHTIHQSILQNSGLNQIPLEKGQNSYLSKVQASLDLGARITCGFEVMYQLSKDSASKNRFSDATHGLDEGLLDAYLSPQLLSTLSLKGQNYDPSSPLSSDADLDRFRATVNQAIFLSSSSPTGATPIFTPASDLTYDCSKVGVNSRGGVSEANEDEVELGIVLPEQCYRRLPVHALIDDTLVTPLPTVPADKIVMTEVSELLANPQNSYPLSRESETAWLYMSPDELDADMDRMIKYYQYNMQFPQGPSPEMDPVPGAGPVNPSEDNGPSRGEGAVKTAADHLPSYDHDQLDQAQCEGREEVNQAQSLDQMVSGMEAFLAAESDYDGVASSLPKTSKGHKSKGKTSKGAKSSTSKISEADLEVQLKDIDWTRVDALVAQANTGSDGHEDLNLDSSIAKTTGEQRLGEGGALKPEQQQQEESDWLKGYFDEEEEDDSSADGDSEGESVDEQELNNHNITPPLPQSVPVKPIPSTQLPPAPTAAIQTDELAQVTSGIARFSLLDKTKYKDHTLNHRTYSDTDTIDSDDILDGEGEGESGQNYDTDSDIGDEDEFMREYMVSIYICCYLS